MGGGTLPVCCFETIVHGIRRFSQLYRFGSEMAWDSTGQEGVYAWSTYFNNSATALNVINSIIAYEPTVPHWGYNGNARRYWCATHDSKSLSRCSYPHDQGQRIRREADAY